MIKLLILSAGLFALVASEALDYSSREFSDYKPLDFKDPSLKGALKAKKSEIILKVVAKHPEVTYNPMIRVNEADSKTNLDFALPKVTVYRANITLLVVKEIPVPVLTFVVTIKAEDYGQEGIPIKYTDLRIYGLPGVDEVPPSSNQPAPNQGRPFGPWQLDLPVSDTGLLAAVDAVENVTWNKITQAVKIKRIPGSYIRNDFVITEAHYRAPKDEGFPVFDYEYEVIISLGLEYKSPTEFQYSFRINVLASYSSGKIQFALDEFKSLGFYSGIKKDTLKRPKQYPPGGLVLKPTDVTADLKDVIVDLKGVLADLKDAKDKPQDRILKPDGTLQINDLMLDKPQDRILKPDGGLQINDLQLDKPQDRILKPDGGLQIDDQMLDKPQDRKSFFGLIDLLRKKKDQKKPADGVKINNFLPDFVKPEPVDYPDFTNLLAKLRKAIISRVNHLSYLDGKNRVIPENALLSPGDIVQVTKQIPSFIDPPFFNRTFYLTNASLYTPLDNYKVLVPNLSLVLSEKRHFESQDGPAIISDEKLVSVNGHLVPSDSERHKLPSLPQEKEPEKAPVQVPLYL